jgi:glucuronosyltransferase
MKLPENVLVRKFLPQNDILAHPKVKAFITHSGLLSSQEACWYGKPMVAVPFFLDQKQIADKSMRLGVGVIVDFRTLDVETFKEAILSVLEDENYWKNAQDVSKLFQDKPQKPLELAVWWIEYVLRNPNAPHYESISLQLGPFAANSYDVILAILTIVIICFYAIFKIILFIKNLLTFSEKPKEKLK